MAVKVSGVKELRKKLKALPPEIKLELESEMEKGANEVVQMAKRLVPVNTGRLRDSIGWTWGEPPKGSIAIAQSRPDPNARVITIFAGSETAYWVRWVEFGTVKSQAHPFFFPSWRANAKKVKSRFKRATKKAIEKVAGDGN